MYDYAWDSAFAPATQSTIDSSKARRRESLLKQASDLNKADVGFVEGLAEQKEPAASNNAPPAATVARRAKSYSDFYDALRAQLKKERGVEKQRRRSKEHPRTELDFGDGYQTVHGELLDASHEEYQVYKDRLRLYQSHLDSLLESTTSTLDLLSVLSDSFRAVEAQTTAFQAQCEGFLSEQKRVVQLADDMAENLQYYTYLEPMTRKLNAPGAGNFVRGKEFSKMLSNLDRCLEYMQAHISHREAPTYRSRYRLLLTRALTLIRVHFTNSLREIAADVSKRIADRQLNDTTMSALLYAKFRSGAAELKQVGLEIQKRAVLPAGAEPGAEAEYQSLMNELYQSYSATRGRLILPIVTKKMGAIAMAPSSSKDLVAFARSTISYMRGICYDEHDLWGEWFASEGGLYDFLEAICEPLYDYLRPRTIHETQILKLCELCTLIQTRYMEGEEDDSEPTESNRLGFSTLIHPALEDAQTRLVFLALAVLRDDIEHYKPRPEDLDYFTRNRRVSLARNGTRPALSGRKEPVNEPPIQTPKTPMVVDEEGGIDTLNAGWGFDTDAALEGLYPTLRKAIWLLSRIYRLVNSSIFDDLAHRIVHQTILSLHAAATQISARASLTDAQLFLIKHLLILKQQIVAFDIEFVTPEISFDFSSMTNTFYELRERGGLFNPRNLMRLVGGGLMPRVVENMLDAKAELDGRLRTVINEFTNAFTTRMTSPIAAASAAKDFDANAATRTIREAAEKEVPYLRKKLGEYLDDERTKETLVAAVQEQVAEVYEEFFERYAKEGQANGRAMVKKKGKGREDELWDPETFAEWTGRVFGVGGVSGMAEDEDGSVGRRSTGSR
ncbi:hypothetical protein B0A49_02572 [Cryomyces minteri]|uniref:Conserved oligomeric Golgi complex subunit 3 n=1 Tax=Cryomyces minteri TaxID=331657 RepID=A0A4U0X4F2_9PEZI|nr:hypothetical protein B0A49_02572 [Cryomyces minteri]